MRIAQEIQRKLEELDVKLKTLEAEGVEVEKKLRGEGNKIFIALYVCNYIINLRAGARTFFTPHN